MNVLFTGLTGFLGTNFLSFQKDEKDCIYPLPCDIGFSSGKNNFSYSFSEPELRQACPGGIDILIHAGAFSPKTRKEMDNFSASAQNVSNTAHLLECLPNVPEKIVYISSVSVYDPKRNKEKITENSPTGGDSVYGISKLMCEKIVQSYCAEHKIPSIVLRLGVMYGNSASYQGLIPVFARKILNGEAIEVYNGGTALKNFIHVKDVCRVLQKCLISDLPDTVVNVVGETSISIRQVAETLMRISGRKAAINSVYAPVLNDTTYDASKMISLFGRNETDYEKGLTEVWRFFTENGDAGL